jgi:hypothetical protein
VKNFKVPNYITIILKKRPEKNPLSFPRKDFKSVKKMGILKKMKIPLTPPKQQVIQPYPSSKT